MLTETEAGSKKASCQTEKCGADSILLWVRMNVRNETFKQKLMKRFFYDIRSAARALNE